MSFVFPVSGKQMDKSAIDTNKCEDRKDMYVVPVTFILRGMLD